MTNEEVMQILTDMGLHEGGMDNWVADNAWWKFANVVAQHERDRIYAEELELPEPRLTGKFSLTAGLFKCSGCTGTWINRKTAQHHSCKDYQ
jgi:hypothetical protein